MKPIEKALDLYEKFSLYTSTGSEDDDYGEYKKANKYFNKNACLLCVDEIIKAAPTMEEEGPPIDMMDLRGNVMYKVDNTNFWEQVKVELQKL